MNKNSYLFSISILLAIWANSISAQGYDFKNLPVINPKPDFNGVDSATGSFITGSPLRFSVPGAGNLNPVHFFNGRTESFSLNVYIDDSTYLPSNFSGDPETERYIRIHLGGTDKLFSCGLNGDCIQNVKKDGSRLTRTGLREYIFTDKEGATYTFFPFATAPIDSSCYDLDGEAPCNMAGYSGYASVASIVYASGEKLTYAPFSSVKTVSGQKYAIDTIQSNLGYRLDLEYTVVANFVPQVVIGWNWFRHRHMGPNNISGTSKLNFLLYKNTELINTLRIDRAWSTPNSTSLIVKHIDDLNRIYQLDFQKGNIQRCSNDGMPNSETGILLPVRQVSPSGVITSIQYHMSSFAAWQFMEAVGGTSIPVFKMTRGGQVWEYDNQSNKKTLKDPYSNTRTVEFSWLHNNWPIPYGVYCPTGNVESIITNFSDELFRQSYYDYDDGLLSDAVLPEGNGYTYSYDSRGNLTEIFQKSKSGSGLSNRPVFRASYPATCDNEKFCNKPTWVENAKGLRTHYTYSATHGGVLSVTQPAQANGAIPQIRYTYSGVNTGDGTVWRLTGTSQCVRGSSCTGNANELKTSITYWGNTFLPATKTESAGDGSLSVTENFTYNNAGLPTQVTDRMGQTTYYFYDAVGRKIGEISPDPDGTGPLPRLATRTFYNNDDKPTSIRTGTVTGGVSLSSLNNMVVTQTVDYTYDNVGRKIQEKKSANGEPHVVIQHSYDANNRLLCSARRMNLSSLPANACVLGATGADGGDRITKNEYDAAGQLVKIYKAYNTPLEQVYTAYEYSDNGNRTAITDANNNKAVLQYDGYDRQTHWYFPSKIKGNLSPSNSDYEQYGYDLNDNRISYRKRDGATLSYQYDNLDRVIQKTVPNRTGLATAHTQNVFYGYDNRGLMIHSRFGSQSGQGITSSYDVLGRMLTSTINLDGISRQLSHAYNNNGIRTQLTHPDNQVFTYVTDAVGRTISITHPASGALATYQYNAQGQMAALTGGGTTNFSYDGIGRLQSLSYAVGGTGNNNVYSYSYNPASQLKQLSTTNSIYSPLPDPQNATYQVNGLNQYTQVTGTNYEYDANGNLTFDGQSRYLYDQENRLVKATTAAGALKAELWYDPMGRLYKMQSPSSTTQFLYDGEELVAEFTGTSTTVKDRYIHGIGVDDPVVWFQGAAVNATSRRNLRANHQGSITLVTNSSSTKLFQPRYDTWGNPQSTHPLRFGYTGQAWLAELGLWYYKARVYSAELGRFLQTDPVGYADQMNMYAYVGNDPANKTDPTGQYARGKGWSDADWEQFDKEQKRVAKDMLRTAGNLRSAASAKREGKDVSDPKGAEGQSADNMDKMAAALEKGAEALNDDGEKGYVANQGPQENGALGRGDRGGKTIWLDMNQLRANSNHVAFYAGHESLHNAGLNDEIWGGTNAIAYRRPMNTFQAKAYKNLPLTQRAKNPDHIMSIVYP